LLPDAGFVNGIGIEVWPAPLDHLGMELMVGIGHGFES
jgi:hypothetical protein